MLQLNLPRNECQQARKRSTFPSSQPLNCEAIEERWKINVTNPYRERFAQIQVTWANRLIRATRITMNGGNYNQQNWQESGGDIFGAPFIYFSKLQNGDGEE